MKSASDIGSMKEEAEERFVREAEMVEAFVFQANIASSILVADTENDMNWFKNINCATIDVAGRTMSRLSLYQ